jgi:hypothetical protein
MAATTDVVPTWLTPPAGGSSLDETGNSLDLTLHPALGRKLSVSIIILVPFSFHLLQGQILICRSLQRPNDENTMPAYHDDQVKNWKHRRMTKTDREVGPLN